MIEYLSGFMLPGREKVLRETLANRTRYMTICLENTYHPQNASALVRNCEAFGIQDIHTVETVCRFTPNANIVRGTDKWVDIRKHPDTPSLVGDLRARGYRIVATSPHADDRTPETFDVEAGPFALFFGTEHAGISEEVVAAADEFVRIPMCGFVESLNVSASAAILLYLLSSRLRASGVPWRIPETERRNPAALDALDRARFRTHSPAGRILDRLSVARAPRAAPVRGGVWKRCASGPYRSFLDPELFRIERPADTCVRGSCSGCRSRGFPRDVSGGPVAVACRSPFPVAGHASCKRFSTGRSEKKPRKMGYSQFLATFATRKCGSSPRKPPPDSPALRVCGRPDMV